MQEMETPWKEGIDMFDGFTRQTFNELLSSPPSMITRLYLSFRDRLKVGMDARSVWMRLSLTPDFGKSDVIWIMKQIGCWWMMKQSAVGVWMEYQHRSWYALAVADRARSMQVYRDHTWRQEANKTCMHIRGYITWGVFVNWVWLALAGLFYLIMKASQMKYRICMWMHPDANVADRGVCIIRLNLAG